MKAPTPRKLLIVLLCTFAPLATAAAAEEEEAHERRNTTELFVGGAYESSENAFVVGLAHEYRFHRYLGIGGFAEYMTSPFEKWSFGVPLFVHPWRGIRLQVAPGFEHHDGEDEFLFRVGAGYEFELSHHWRLIPEVLGDFVDGERAILYGVTIGYAW